MWLSVELAFGFLKSDMAINNRLIAFIILL